MNQEQASPRVQNIASPAGKPAKSAFTEAPIFSAEAADFSFLRPLRPTLLFTAFWLFAAERQHVFWQRVQGLPPPWTLDPVLAIYKFTNAYRASDRVSQHLTRSLIYAGAQKPRELFFRTVLFKLFNRIETWRRLLHVGVRDVLSRHHGAAGVDGCPAC